MAIGAVLTLAAGDEPAPVHATAGPETVGVWPQVIVALAAQRRGNAAACDTCCMA